MKKKLIFALATVFFAVATIFNMNLLQDKSAGDVSLESIAVLAQAQNSEQLIVDTESEWYLKNHPDGREQARLKDLASNEWYTNWYMPGQMAECISWVCDTFDLTGNTIREDRQYPDGSWTTDTTNDCDGQPVYC